MDILSLDPTKFIDLNAMAITFLFLVGFIGGLVSGFIGSGGAFVLTPGMMSLGVPGTVAVASNMCHKFPKALVGAIKRYRFGQVDVKMGLIMAASAGIGVQVGIKIQQIILAMWGQVGSDLYVSLSFVFVLVFVGGYVMKDAIKCARCGGEDGALALDDAFEFALGHRLGGAAGGVADGRGEKSGEGEQERQETFHRERREDPEPSRLCHAGRTFRGGASLTPARRPSRLAGGRGRRRVRRPSRSGARSRGRGGRPRWRTGHATARWPQTGTGWACGA